jgi:hypothetical protein
MFVGNWDAAVRLPVMGCRSSLHFMSMGSVCRRVMMVDLLWLS